MTCLVTLKAPVIIWIKPDGRAEPLKTSVNGSQRIMSAEITHFSIYGGAETIVGFVGGLLGWR